MFKVYVYDMYRIFGLMSTIQLRIPIKRPLLASATRTHSQMLVSCPNILRHIYRVA